MKNEITTIDQIDDNKNVVVLDYRHAPYHDVTTIFVPDSLYARGVVENALKSSRQHGFYSYNLEKVTNTGVIYERWYSIGD